MVYPWSKKSSEEEDEAEVKEEVEKEIIEKTNGDTDQDIPESGKDSNEESDKEIVDSLILNILKLEGYKMDSGELFQAFKEAGGKMENFKNELDSLSEAGKIKSDSDGNIMAGQDYNQEKSRQEEENAEETVTEEIEENNETVEEITEEENDSEDIESIIKLKEETDTWLIEQLKNKGNNGNEEELRNEIAELRGRVEKLENVINNMNKAFE